MSDEKYDSWSTEFNIVERWIHTDLLQEDFSQRGIKVAQLWLLKKGGCLIQLEKGQWTYDHQVFKDFIPMFLPHVRILRGRHSRWTCMMLGLFVFSISLVFFKLNMQVSRTKMKENYFSYLNCCFPSIYVYFKFYEQKTFRHAWESQHNKLSVIQVVTAQLCLTEITACIGKQHAHVTCI